MRNFEVNGILPIVPTPFTPDDGLDFEGLASLLDFAVRAQVCGVCLPAYASEFYKLDDGERQDMATRAVELSQDRIPVVGQVNHVSAAYVGKAARELERTGVAAISVAVPRLFELPEADLLRYFDKILTAISVPLIIQDFNPGGASVSLNFVQELHAQHPHFRYLKLEEPLLSGKVRAILDSTSGEVGVIDGWGGIYMLELIDAGICGVMPGLGVADILQKVWLKARAEDKDSAYELFQHVLPQISYSLQNLEFFHHTEKALLAARGVRLHTVVRDATLTIDECDRAHIEFLNRKILEVVDKLEAVPAIFNV